MNKIWLLALSTVLTLGFSAQAPAKAQVVYTIKNTAEPPVIRVAIRSMNPSGEADPRGRVVWVQTVPFDQYCRDVLPNEWVPSWNLSSLQAGAMAVKMFAWYHHLHPVTIDGFTFDVDNTVNFQSFRYQSAQPQTNAAYASIKKFAYVKPNGEIIELNYRAGYRDDPNWQYRNAQKMAQWGSQYWAEKGRNYVQILQFYYLDRTLSQIRS